jgi:large subunit ribosomal protein L19e
MVNLAKQKRIAAEVLKVGKGRVWIDPEASESVAEAITREDIRGLITDGVIAAHQKRGVSKGRARFLAHQKALGRRRGHGSRKGTKGARISRKRRWIIKIRALRRRLHDLREEGMVDHTMYRKLYGKAKGGEFRSIAHLNDIVSELRSRQQEAER